MKIIAIDIMVVIFVFGVLSGVLLKKYCGTDQKPCPIVKKYNDTAIKKRISIIEDIIGAMGLLDNKKGIQHD